MRKHSIAMLWLLLYATSAYAYKGDDRVPGPVELRLLPAYCGDTQIISRLYDRQQAPGNYDAHTKPFIDLYGEDFWHMHHYCFGLNRVIQADRAFDSATRNRRLEESIGEYDYVIKSIRPDSILQPELHTRKGMSLVRLKRTAAAIVEFEKAIELRPDEWIPYAYLSDIYKEMGKNQNALSTLEDGLTRQPGSKALLRRYKDLGGKKIFTAVDNPAKNAKPDSSTAPRESTPALPETSSEHPRETPAPKPDLEPSTPVNPDQPKDNPYCRFCP